MSSAMIGVYQKGNGITWQFWFFHRFIGESSVTSCLLTFQRITAEMWSPKVNKYLSREHSFPFFTPFNREELPSLKVDTFSLNGSLEKWNKTKFKVRESAVIISGEMYLYHKHFRQCSILCPINGEISIRSSKFVSFS